MAIMYLVLSPDDDVAKEMPTTGSCQAFAYPYPPEEESAKSFGQKWVEVAQTIAMAAEVWFREHPEVNRGTFHPVWPAFGTMKLSDRKSKKART